MENSIEQIADGLQRLPPEIRWLAANMQGLIQAAGMATEPDRGPWERRGRRLVVLASRFGLERPLTSMVNVIFLLALYAAQFRVRAGPAPQAPLFIGIQALREPDMVRHFKEMQGRPVVQIDGRGEANFFTHGRVPLLALWREMGSVRRDVWKHIGQVEALSGISTLDTVNHLMTRGHGYAFLRAWFRQYLRVPGASPVVACTVSNSGAYAAVAAGAKVVYMLHGFQRHSNIYTDFSQCICFTTVEAAFMLRRLPRCEVTTVAKRPVPLETRRIAAVAGIFWEPDGFDRVRPFIEWARRSGMDVVVRKHPFDTSDYWEQWRGVPGVELAKGEESFAEFLDAVRPRFLATWYSTALFDALARGIVPVTVCPDSMELLDTVYPVRELSLCWPEHESLAQSLIDNERARAEFLSRRFALAAGSAVDNDAAASSVPAA